ncbi:flagellar motor protein MotB [Litorisediminicola beolgyonensis]|uniref:Flagellar motor protein MotB n=1 Tax=Litorisediminicola beolgyonensis TaxID=1173614 RepID=A0ABW3ZGR1_9RHOB
MASKNNAAPVIIKRKKVIAASGHHGGAWKVAYADFVTAMMAFFLLMWLLNATTEKQRKGLADYFSPTVSVSRMSSGGQDMLQGDSVMASDTLSSNGIGATSATPERASPGTDEDPDGALAAMREMETVLLDHVVEAAEGNAFLRHVETRISDEGLVITLSDLPGAPLFEKDADPTALLDELAEFMVEMSGLVTNDIAISGHVATSPIVLKTDPSWPRSNARAQAMHRLFLEHGLDPERIERITAHGDRVSIRATPMAIPNNRIEIVYLL